METSKLRTKECYRGMNSSQRVAAGLSTRSLRNQWDRQHKTLCYAMDVNARINRWWMTQHINPRDKFTNKTIKKKRLILKVAANA